MTIPEGQLPAYEISLGTEYLSLVRKYEKGSESKSIPRTGSSMLSLNVNQLNHVTTYIGYKVGWNFSVEEYDPLTGPYFVIRVTMPDSRDMNSTVDLVIRSMIPPQKGVAEFIQWVMWRIRQVEIHELQEHFRYEGELVWNPHQELDDVPIL